MHFTRPSRLRKSFVTLVIAAWTVTLTATSTQAATSAPAQQVPIKHYLNLHQCAYLAFTDTGSHHYTNVTPNTPNTPFNTGTNTSNTPDAALQCGPGGGGWTFRDLGSALVTLDLW